MQVLLGIDVGSSGAKARAVTTAGEAIGDAAAPYPTAYPRTGWAEQDPQDWARAAAAASRSCLDAAGASATDVAAVAVVGPAHNVALLDDEGEVVRPTLHWSDLRSAPQVERLERVAEPRVTEVSGQRPHPSWTLPQLMWLRDEEPANFARLRRFAVTKDYVRGQLTGDYLTDPYDAVGTQLYDLAGGEWSQELLAMAALETVELPQVRAAYELAGEVLPDGGAAFGVAAGTPVVVGTADIAVEALACGALRPGDGVVKLGTAGCLDLVTERPLPTATTLTYRYVDGDQGFTVACTNTGTAAFRWLRETLGGGRSFEQLVALADAVPAAANGLLFHPYLMGERTPYWDPYLRGVFTGITPFHDLGHLTRAVLEGVALSIAECAVAAESTGQRIESLALVGGGARADTWAQITADVLDRPLRRPPVTDAAYGAALLAGVGAGIFGSLPEAAGASLARRGQRFDPGPAAPTYAEVLAVYRELIAATAPLHRRLAALGNDARDAGDAGRDTGHGAGRPAGQSAVPPTTHRST